MLTAGTTPARPAAWLVGLLLGLLLVLSCARGLAAPPEIRADRRVDHRAGNRLLKEGARLHNSGRYEEAIARFREAYDKDGSLTRVLVLIGASALNLGRADEALVSYERYEEVEKALRPEDRVRLHAYYEEAAAKIEDDLRRDPARSELLLYAGRARYDLGQLGPALDHYERYRKAGPADEGKRARLGVYLGQLRERLLLEDRQGPGRKEVVLLLSRVCGELGLKEEQARYQARYQALLPPPPAPPAPNVASPPVARVVRAPRPRWRLVLGGVALSGGALTAGFGISGLAVSGTCQEALEAPLAGCRWDYATGGIGAGLLSAGLVLVAGGAVLIALPGERRTVWR